MHLIIINISQHQWPIKIEYHIHMSQHLWLNQHDTKQKDQVPIHATLKTFKLTIPKSLDDSVINASDIP